MRASFRLGRVAGVPVGVNWSVLVIFALIAWGLAANQFPRSYPDRLAWAYLLAGLAAAVVFFVGLLAHEVSHAVVAKRNGLEVEGITLWLFGGVAELRGEAARPGRGAAHRRGRPAGQPADRGRSSAPSRCCSRWPGRAGCCSGRWPGWPASTCCWRSSTCCRPPPGRWPAAARRRLEGHRRPDPGVGGRRPGRLGARRAADRPGPVAVPVPASASAGSGWR